jgi:hypothetical protein
MCAAVAVLLAPSWPACAPFPPLAHSSPSCHFMPSRTCAYHHVLPTATYAPSIGGRRHVRGSRGAYQLWARVVRRRGLGRCGRGFRFMGVRAVQGSGGCRQRQRANEHGRTRAVTRLALAPHASARSPPRLAVRLRAVRPPNPAPQRLSTAHSRPLPSLSLCQPRLYRSVVHRRDPVPHAVRPPPLCAARGLGAECAGAGKAARAEQLPPPCGPRLASPDARPPVRAVPERRVKGPSARPHATRRPPVRPSHTPLRTPPCLRGNRSPGLRFVLRVTALFAPWLQVLAMFRRVTAPPGSPDSLLLLPGGLPTPGLPGAAPGSQLSEGCAALLRGMLARDPRERCGLGCARASRPGPARPLCGCARAWVWLACS